MNVQTMAQEVIKTFNKITYVNNQDDIITDILSDFAIKMYNEGYKTANDDAKNVVQEIYQKENQRINDQYGKEVQRINKQLHGILQDVRNIRW